MSRSVFVLDMSRSLYTVVLYVGGRTFQTKILKCIFLVSLAHLGLERSGNVDFTTPGAQKVGKIASSNWLIYEPIGTYMSILQCKEDKCCLCEFKISDPNPQEGRLCGLLSSMWNHIEECHSEEEDWFDETFSSQFLDV